MSGSLENLRVPRAKTSVSHFGFARVYEIYFRYLIVPAPLAWGAPVKRWAGPGEKRNTMDLRDNPAPETRK